MIKEVRKELPAAYLTQCKARQTGKTLKAVIGDYKQALDECNGKIYAIRKLQETATSEQDFTDEMSTQDKGENDGDK